MNPLTAAVAYFALVFAAGFAMGTLRQLVLLRWLSERAAELVEMPVMLLLSFLAARFIVARLRSAKLRGRLVTGGGALLLLLVAELLVVLRLRGIGLGDYVAGRDPVAGSAYAISLVLFALMPALVGARRRAERRTGERTPPDP